MSDSKASSSNPTSSSANLAEIASRKDYYGKRGSSRIYLYELLPRWRKFKDTHALKTDADVAQILLDSFDATEGPKTTKQALW